MAQQLINVGTSADDDSGDPIRTSFEKTNANDTELYAKAAALAAKDNELASGAAIQVIATGTTTARSLSDRFADVVSVKDFGATTANSAIQNDLAFQACFDYCRDNNQRWFIPRGSWSIGAVTAFTGGVCDGELVITNNAQTTAAFSIVPVAADVTAFTLAQINAWTFITRGVSESSELIPYPDSYIVWLSGDENMINRLGAPASERMREGIIVQGNEGKFYPAIKNTKTTSWGSGAASAIRIRPPIEIVGLRVRVSGGSVARAACISITRPNAIMRGCGIVNDTVTNVQQGFQVDDCCMLVLDGCYVEGLGEVSTEYAYSPQQVCDLTLISCREHKSRRGLEGHGAKQVTVLGGSYPDGIGAHWGHDYKVIGAYVSADAPNTAPFYFCGSDLSVTNCTIRLQSELFSVFSSREDLYEVRGSVRLDNNDVEIDVSSSLSGTRWIVDLLAGASTDGQDWGRLVYLPDYVSIQGNRIVQRGGSWTGSLMLIQWGSNKAFADGASGGGKMVVRGNCFQFESGSVSAKCSLTLAKQAEWTAGNGYDLVVEDVPSLQMFLTCALARSDNNQRVDVTLRNIGVLYWQANFGAFKTVQYDCRTLATTTRPSGTVRTTPAGDETETRTGTVLYATGVWNPVSIATGQSSSITFTVPGTRMRDRVAVNFANGTAGLTAGWIVFGNVTANDTVTVTLFNASGVTGDFSSSVVDMWVTKSPTNNV